MKLLAPLAMALGLIFAPMGAMAAADEDAALATAEKLVDGAHGALTSSAPSAQKNAALRETLSETFAFDIWERFLIDAKKAGFSKEQQAEFDKLLPGFLANLYANQFGRGLEEKPVIKEARKARRDILVRAGIPRANGKTLPVDWRIRDFGDRGHRVIDVMVGGTSFLILKRDEFNGLLKQGGPEALLSFMRENSI